MKNFWMSAKGRALAVLVCLCAAGAYSPGATVAFERPAMDVWMYGSGFNRGYRENAPIFGGPLGANGSDDRLGQFVMGWDTAAAGIPAGMGAANYHITRVTLRATHVNHNVFTYDPTYDGYRTYRDLTDPLFLPDADAGRPIELHGLGLRNGFTHLALSGSATGSAFGESTTSFSTGTGEHTRHAYAWAAGTPRPDGDVSENVTEGFESNPFAIGTATGLMPGQLVPADTEFTFQIDLNAPAILAYLRDALDNGQLGLTLSSMHPASFSGNPGPQQYPRFYTRDYFDLVPQVVPYLEIEYTLIPEPSPGHIFILSAAFLAASRAWARRHYYS